eukprot:CAMPEP_0172739188 /NCGR_PEP_ID=MMETSP1074-20121228/122011_1 /TAXON_ID=2916 /ORGANISM="Ceratium fusus, Strain PA161109" /LENGTH=196 /DNA_ID=CAMNT_0013568997 /DNA_START=21 /DNA_END=608 /DNA_ORIENTATION=-
MADQDDPRGLLPFFQGTGTDSEGRKLKDLRSMGYDDMEMIHDYIQWMFPTDEASQFNWDAPLLGPELQRTFSSDPDLQQEIRLNLGRFCEFLGLELRIAGPVDDGASHTEVVMAAHFKDRVPDCWRPMFGGNHNWLRISRVLQCLGLCSMFEEQAAFYKCLETLHEKGVPCDSAMPHWRSRAQTKPAFAAAATAKQ